MLAVSSIVAPPLDFRLASSQRHINALADGGCANFPEACYITKSLLATERASVPREDALLPAEGHAVKPLTSEPGYLLTA